MKIFMGENNSCNLNYQYHYIYEELYNKNFEFTDEVWEADIIVLASTCCCTANDIKITMNYINDVVKYKKKSAKIFLTGCITRDFMEHEELNKCKEWLRNNIDYIIPQNEPDKLLKLISNEFNDELNEYFGYYGFYSRDEACIYITNGCLNNCSFCKNCFQNYPLKSMDIDRLKMLIDILDEEKIKELDLIGTNVSQYGLDLYREYKILEIIDYLEKKKNISKVNLIGFSFSDAIHNGFADLLRDSSKINMLSGSLESGSNRLLKLIKKGFTSDEIIEFAHYISEIHNKMLILNIIAGFPTETLDEVYKTLEVLKELNPEKVYMCRYIDSPYVDSHKYTQLNGDTINEHARIYQKVLKNRNINLTYYK